MNKELKVMPRTQDQGKEHALEDKTMAEVIMDKSISPEDQRKFMLSHWGRIGGKKGGKKARKYHPKFVEIARRLATLGLPEEDMAVLFGVSTRHFSGWKRRHQALGKAIKEGDSMKRISLLDAIMQNVEAGNFAVQIFLAKNWLGMTDKVDTKMTGTIGITYKSNIPQEKGIQGPDPTSMKRRPKKK